MAKPLKLLIVEDRALDADLMVRELERAGFAPEWKRVDTERQYLENLHPGLDLVISDYEVPQFNGLRALELLRTRDYGIPFILVSGTIGEDLAVRAMKHGVTDYLLKDRLARLGAAVQHALDESRLRHERLKAEEAKAALEAQLRLLETGVARINDIVLITEAEPHDEPGPRIVFVNDAFVRRTGYSREETLGRSPWFLRGPKTSQAEVDRIREAMGRWEPVRAELINYTKSGDEFWLELDVVPVADAKGRFTHWVAVERDITERKATEAALRASEERLRIVTENARVGLVMVNSERRYTFANSTYAEMLGLPSPDIVGQRVAEVLPSLYEPQIRSRLDRAFAGERVTYELTRPTADGDRYYTVKYEPTQAGTVVPLVVVVLTDVTERKQAQDTVRVAAEKMRALAVRMQAVREEERTTIAREIHDVLAQELTRLKIDLVWVARRLARPADDSSHAAITGRVADALAQTDTAISTVQRIATDLRPVILDSLGLNAALEWQVEDFARRTGLVWHVKVPRGETALTRDRATAIFRILQESLTNVTRHAQAFKVEVKFTESAGAATLVVRDDGVGITRAQIENPHSIGLIGMKERAQAFGGSVEIGGSPGAGTTVTVCLPLEAPAQPTLSP